MLALRGIRKRLFIGALLLSAAVIGLALPLSVRFMERSFRAFELGKAGDDAARLQLVIAQRTDQMRKTATDYGNWFEAVAYIKHDNPLFIGENLYPDILSNFDFDYVFITDAELNLRYLGAAPDYVGASDRSRLQPLPTSIVQPLLAAPHVRARLQRRDGIGLIRQQDGRWYLVGVSPITSPDEKSEPVIYGLFGFVTELTPQRQAAWRELAQVPFLLQPLSAGAEQTRIVDGQIQTVRQLADTDGAPMATLQIDAPRPLAAQTRIARRTLVALSLGMFLLLSLLVWALLEYDVISRLVRMDHGLQAIRGGQQTLLPLSNRNDEIDRLGRSVNELYAELSRVNRQWRHEAHHDALTGLGNRALLLRQIETKLHDRDRAGAGAGSLGLLLLDLDGFKAVNDVFGHAVGDRVLVRVADCLRDHLPPQAQAFRLGGDEFAVLLEPCTREQALALAATLNGAIRSGHFADNLGTQLSTSIGVAHAPESGRVPHASELIQQADIALYNVKRGDRDGHALFDDSMRQAIQQRNEIERALRSALADGRIEAWYQPIVSADDHRVLRLEALARWHHDERGWIEPSRFVAIAEQNSMAAALDLTVLRAAVLALPQIRALAPHAGLAVNVSVQSLLDGDYVAAVPQILAEGGLNGSDLILELTETMLTENEQVLARPIAALREHGVLIQLDDFGVGYSSLGRLAQLDPLGIKLDGSFVLNRRHGGDRVCRAVIGLADQLGMQVTAEFVETSEDAQFLRSAGCSALQGYWLTAPLPLAQLLEWLRVRAASTEFAALAASTGEQTGSIPG